MEVSKGVRPSLVLVATILCAGLYATGSYATAYIPSPWGFGQFRPAVVIPAFFAVIFGPMSGGVGAAIGTLIVDSVKHGRIYEGSLIAAVPGNFIGFYLFGYIVKRKFTWGRFILASNLTLTIANFITAFLYVFAFRVLYLSQFADASFGVLMFLAVGLTIWWFVTMLPFVLMVTPPLIRAVSGGFPSLVPEGVRTNSLGRELPKLAFSLAMLIPGILMISIGLATTYTGLGEAMSTGLLQLFQKAPQNVPVIMALIQLMFYLSGAVLSILGLLFYTGQKLYFQKTSAK